MPRWTLTEDHYDYFGDGENSFYVIEGIYADGESIIVLVDATPVNDLRRAKVAQIVQNAFNLLQLED